MADTAPPSQLHEEASALYLRGIEEASTLYLKGIAGANSMHNNVLQ